MSGHVVVGESGLGRYQQEVIAGEHRLLEIASKCPTARRLAQPLVLACRLTD